MVINYAKCIYCKIFYNINFNKNRLLNVTFFKKSLFFVIILFFSFLIPIYAELNSGMIFQIPSAALSQTPMIEGGMITSVGYHKNNIKFIGQGFLKAHLTPRIGIQGVMHHEFSGVGVHVVIHKFSDPKSNASHYFGAGTLYSNMSSIPASYPLVNSYINYSIEFLGSRAHLGVGSNAINKPAFVSFLGLEVELDKGYTFLEFLGTVFNLGYAHKLKNNMQGLVIFTPNFNEDPSLEAMVLNFGIRVVDPFEYVHQREKEKLIGLIEEKKKSEEEREELSTQSLADAIDSIKTSDQYVRGGEYELARDEMLAVIEIFPTAKNYSKLGSIYYKLENVDEAIYHWDKALKIDPYDKKLKSFVNKIKKESGYLNIEATQKNNNEEKSIKKENQDEINDEQLTEEASESDFINVPIPNKSEETTEEATEEATEETTEEAMEETTEEATEETTEEATEETAEETTEEVENE